MDQNHELLLLKNIAEILNTETDMLPMLQQVLDRLLQLTKLSTGWIFLVDEEHSFQLAAHASLPEALSFQNKRYMCEGGCWCLDRFKDGKLLKATNIIECQRIEGAITNARGDTNGITHHASIPLKSGDELFGLMNVASPHKRNFSNSELAVLESVAFQIGTAIQRILLFEKEKNYHIIEERNRLARDLHDTVNQLLFSIMYTANGTSSLTKEKKVKKSLTRIQQMSKEALAEMKSLIWQLRNETMEDGLKETFSRYGVNLGLSINYTAELPFALSVPLREVLCKIGKEAINNIFKHAKTDKVHISIFHQNNSLIMEVKDDGIGFEEDKISTGFGLTSMRERAKLVNGECDITSGLGKGTKISVTIPYETKEGIKG
ncbi:GAF domain-containing sensor histidine kinase [Evansella tamaricis]|uniref:histidine kinase n=1 Tax=Evansella tamaricis TaxID=2069301 RepID=A0ABS6JLW6_9BACI|nr:GAF domain-containing sensor histidine kinase [Evansella tamaricis]MBU9713420.1 GAF domain-containing sensor histidine kinase [Evansella tamaricis]